MKKVIFLFVLLFACALTLASCVEITNECEHEFGAWQITKEATCKEAGERVRKCTKCDETETEAIPVDANAHKFGEYELVTDATCGVAGEEKRTCELCGKEEFKEIPPTGEHSYGEWVVDIEPYKGVDGREKHECEVCHDVEYRPLADTRVYANDNWTVSGSDKAAFEYVGETIVCLNEETMSNENHYDVGHVNMNIIKADAPEFFVMSAKIKGTITEALTEGNDVYTGLVFDFEDDNNYRALIIRWTTWDRPNEIRSFFFIKVEDGVYTNLGDNWCDGCDIKPGSAIEITLTKALTINGEVVTALVSGKGGTWTKSASTTFELKKGKCGICGANDNFVYSNISVEENAAVVKTNEYTCGSDKLVINYYLGTFTLTDSVGTTTGEYELAGKKATLKADGKDDVTVVLGDGTFEYENAAAYTVIASLKDGATYTVAENVIGDAKIKFSFESAQAAGMTEDTKVGVYFKFDDDNFFEPMVQWGVNRGGFEEIRELSVQGTLGGSFVGWDDGWADGNKKTPADGGVVEFSIAMAEGKTVVTIVYTSGEYTKTWSREFSQVIEGSYSILIFGKGSVNFDIHDLETVVTDGKELKFSNVTENMTISFDAVGTIASSVSGEVQCGAKFYANDDNYVSCYAAWQSWDRPQEIRNTEVNGKVSGAAFGGSDWHDAFTDNCGIHPADTIHYQIVKEAGKFTLTITCGEYSKVNTAEDAAFDAALDYVLSIYGFGDTFTITNISIQ